ncbi:MAG: hypothetical protein ABH919_02600 [bacterium]
MDKQENNQEEYISLTEATKQCSYSQEYLSLRARSGKLKAKKIGRNWVTKKEWLAEYVQGVEEYNKIMEARQIKKQEAPVSAPAVQEVAVPEEPVEVAVIKEVPIQEDEKTIEAPIVQEIPVPEELIKVAVVKEVPIQEDEKTIEAPIVQEIAVPEEPVVEVVSIEEALPQEIKATIEPPKNLPVEDEATSRKLSENISGRNIGFTFNNFIALLKKATETKLAPVMIAILAVSLFTLSFHIGERTFHPIKNFVVGMADQSYYIIQNELNLVDDQLIVDNSFPADFSRGTAKLFKNDSIFVQDMKRGVKNIEKKTEELVKEAFFQTYVMAVAGDIIVEGTGNLFYGSFKTVSEDIVRIAMTIKGQNSSNTSVVGVPQKGLESSITINDALAQLSQLFLGNQAKEIILWIENTAENY